MASKASFAYPNDYILSPYSISMSLPEQSVFNPYASPQSRFINQEANFLKANPSDLSGIVSCPHFYKSLGLMGASEFSLSEPSLCRALSSHITYKVYFTSASMLPFSALSSASKCKGIVACNKCLSRLMVF